MKLTKEHAALVAFCDTYKCDIPTCPSSQDAWPTKELDDRWRGFLAATERMQDGIEEMRGLVAMYQCEGRDEIPEETEYKTLVSIGPAKRTPEQTRRVAALANIIRDALDTTRLRNENAKLRKVIEKYGTIRHKADCDTFNCDCGLDKLKRKAGLDQREAKGDGDE